MHTLIVGAGPTGLTLAIDLARRGLDVRIIDKTARFFDGSRGDGIQPRTLEVFDDLGVIADVLDQGAPQPVIRMFQGGEQVRELRMSEPRDPTPAVPYPNPWVLGQSQTEAILRNRSAEFGVQVELDTELVGFDQGADGVTATLHREGGSETVRADYLVGADGAASTVRKLSGIGFEGSTDESIRMVLGDVRADALDHDYGYWFGAADNPREGIVLSPLPGDRFFQFGMPARSTTEPTLRVLQHCLETYSDRTDIRLDDLRWCTVWRPNVRLAHRYRDRRVFLAGDAAHVHPPAGGQGLNTGIQDAYNLGWKLSDGSPDLLASYESERRPVAARVLGLSTELLRRHTDGDENAHHRGEDTHQLDITYRAPSAAGRVVTGDRAPDAPLLDSSGHQIRLFDLFRGPHATLLCFDSPAPTDLTPGISAWSILRRTHTRTDHDRYVIDSAETAFESYDAQPGTRILVRPDGYVGTMSTG
ncbi:FAD-dependent oxidoreductase [Nocardia uniformis]|uniref:FAD-dependent oxidoreductase n=1 Tax=Nocardia uniformis TaxID=53432 RepID=A0A849C2M6_9NOCA|nr:FAD-dependent monooxygenase [Nocardia uniformis]NNH70565.1 FAD-dependent oxidoreductase [Nocardia uniformis]